MDLGAIFKVAASGDPPLEISKTIFFHVSMLICDWFQQKKVRESQFSTLK
jgi:hypothetical protein